MNTDKKSEMMWKVKDLVLKSMLLLSIAISIVICGEAIVRRQIADLYVYIYTNTRIFIMEVWFVLGMLVLCYYLINNIGLATLIAGGVTGAAYIINYYKYSLKGEYVGPADIFLLQETKDIAGYFKFEMTSQMMVAIIGILCIAAIGMVLKEKIVNRRMRLAGSVLGVVLVLSSVAGIIGNIAEADINPNYVNLNYENNGFLFTFINRISELNIKVPKSYSKDRINSIVNGTEIEDAAEINVKPNIIFIMSEAFYDPTVLPNIEYSQDPISYFRSLTEEYAGGNLITAVFGGSTAQTEYEVLTGNSVDLTGKDNIAYTRYMYEGMPSLVSVLEKLGYYSMAIHPYERTFYSRDVVYSELGFNEYLSQEDFIEPERTTSYISDRELYKKIISEYEAKKAQFEKPVLIHTVTMQNHGPYSIDYNKYGITVESNKLDQETKQLLERYSNLIKESDEALQELIKYFETVEEPTIIVMFGDHPPALGDDYAAYRQLEAYSGEEDAGSSYMVHHTPYLIWNNYGQKFNSYEYMDASYLGAVVLKESGIDVDVYFNYLYEQMAEVAAYNEAFYINSSNRIESLNEMTESESQLIEDLWTLQYDRIFGEDYIDRND